MRFLASFFGTLASIGGMLFFINFLLHLYDNWQGTHLAFLSHLPYGKTSIIVGVIVCVILESFFEGDDHEEDEETERESKRD
ncbi:hypothetical protein [Staphylococcus pettenkoferi]|uniref:hypothetical protein n=1 Tax=Staphylococcus pettenkoferi TaxID=170573 RepID=UPI000243214C|nr:hypothetical protein [Staphylococcus pettenkoferi]ASE37531.1 hypothetical protein CEP67_09670 [Staphylococcus pettenkoferi]EHM71345.1 hypothetical protein SEVCU012_2322 [Staphylococcus pettenkoferi VCU012]MCY1580787.1 hypothetical protein [Staphylococcus pettenkoferi]MCY1619969.1 hypothetical protein [Staphylococcus pettenkoferi]